MKKENEFYVGYSDELGPNTKRQIKRFVMGVVVVLVLGVTAFSLSQKPFVNSTFELGNETVLTGIYHEAPYPMLRIPVAGKTYKNILLLGFGKSSVNPYLNKIKKEVVNLQGKEITIEGNLIYYNGKTLIQITDDEKVHVKDPSFKSNPPIKHKMGKATYMGEIVDPKCYFGVMKPGFGKIHRSCAIRCISGGIPPVFATKDKDGNTKYLLLTDLSGNRIHSQILNYIGKPAKITGSMEQLEDWDFLRISTQEIKLLDRKSMIYVN